ncbi:MAG: ADOP family duplicated permease [Vicinamibacterales bacterium]
MRRLRAVWRNLTGWARRDRDLQQELDSYLDLAADERRTTGLSDEEARRGARLEMGGVEQVKEQVRAVRAGAIVREVAQDARFGLRLIRRSPAFLGAALLTLGLGIGAAGAMAAVVNVVLVRDLPFANPDRLLAIDGLQYRGELLELDRRAQSIDAALYELADPVTLTGAGEPERLPVAAVSGTFFGLLGIPAAHGHAIGAAEARPGAPAAVVISDALWRRRFGGDPTLVGRTIELDGRQARVAGIMPARFWFPSASIDVWRPLQIDPADRVPLWSRGGRLIARLRPGRSMDDAQAEIRAVAPSMRALFPWQMPEDYGRAATVTPLKRSIVGSSEAALLVLLAAVACVWLVACLNVGLLVVGRSAARRSEWATRAALGASRARLVRQVIVECVALAGVAGAAGAAVAVFGLRLLVRLLPADTPRLAELTPDAQFILIVGGAATLAGLLVSLAPVWQAVGTRPAQALGPRGAVAGAGGRRLAGLLVAVEVAVAVVLAVGAALFVQSLNRLLSTETGFERDQVVTAVVSPAMPAFAAAAPRRTFIEELLARLEAAPDVVSVAVTNRLPFGDALYGSVFIVEGHPDPSTGSGDWPYAEISAAVSPRYFATLGVPVRAGRAFDDGDGPTAERVAIVNEALARKYWPGEDVVGRRLRFPDMARDAWVRVVGVVGDTRWSRMDAAPEPALYVPAAQVVPVNPAVVMRTSATADGASAQLRAIVSAIDGGTPVDRVVTLDDLVRQSAGRSRALALLVSGFGLVGVMLGAIGVYGVAADAAARRRHEIGLRLALGASPGAVLRLVLRDGLWPVALGVVGGTGAAFLLGGVVRSLLTGISPGDPLTFAATVVGLGLVAAAASLLPALRATRIDPLAVLQR